jgi:hypothetical protein
MIKRTRLRHGCVPKDVARSGVPARLSPGELPRAPSIMEA